MVAMIFTASHFVWSFTSRVESWCFRIPVTDTYFITSENFAEKCLWFQFIQSEIPLRKLDPILLLKRSQYSWNPLGNDIWHVMCSCKMAIVDCSNMLHSCEIVDTLINLSCMTRSSIFWHMYKVVTSIGSFRVGSSSVDSLPHLNCLD